MAEHRGQRDRQITVASMQVGRTQPGRDDPDEHFVSPRLIEDD
ncbi:MAG TPA: hypothetical protein VGM10_10465 [Actinocrinis sp.]